MTQNILDKFNLKGKVAVITATTRGLGLAMAQGLAEAGATIVALDRSENNGLPDYCASLGVKFKRIKVDLLKVSQQHIDGIIAEVIKEFLKIDILVNNAGITRRGEIEEFTETDWLDVLQVNLTAPFYLCRAVAKYFIKQKSGKIINIASILSYQGGLRVPSYVASKHGIVGLTRNFANGLAEHGINVNAIAPGFFETDLTQPLHDDEERNKLILSRVPSGRWGNPDELKGVVVWLASDASSFVNGAVISVDGGWLSR